MKACAVSKDKLICNIENGVSQMISSNTVKHITQIKCSKTQVVKAVD